MYEQNTTPNMVVGAEHVDITSSEQIGGLVVRIRSGKIILTSLTLHPGVTTRMWAFGECKGLKSVVIHQGVKIGEDAFDHCIGLKSVVIHQGVTIGNHAFCRCAGLTSVIIPPGVRIEKSAFYGCTGLTSVVIHPGVAIGERAFAGCTGLKRLSITILKDEEKETWKNSADFIGVNRDTMTFTRAQVPTLKYLAMNAVRKLLEKNPNLKYDDLKKIVGYHLANDFYCKKCENRLIYNDFLPRHCFICNPKRERICS